MDTSDPFEPGACSSQLHGTTLRVHLSGPIDLVMQDLLRRLLTSRCGLFDRAIIDMREVTFFGATGVNFVAMLAATGATVQLLNVSSRTIHHPAVAGGRRPVLRQPAGRRVVTEGKLLGLQSPCRMAGDEGSPGGARWSDRSNTPVRPGLPIGCGSVDPEGQV
ncbi:hypothetical protein [Cryptosporangium sp. NPDC048952]|uniref:hypothetical protein n=1 Tax=Cryptosporangium sp. NPDC048952 TaxID=3363961 RepID=UPI00371A5F81